MSTMGLGNPELGTLKVVAARVGPQKAMTRNESTGKELRIARCYAPEVSER
jgi:hypothetical protein